MAKTYYTYRICVKNDQRVEVEIWDAQHHPENERQAWGNFGYQENQEEIETLLNIARNNQLNKEKVCQLGEVLFNCLFDERLAQNFIDFYNKVVKQDGQLLRIELDIDEKVMPKIAALPWEFLRLPTSTNQGTVWLATHPNLVFYRRRRLWNPAQSIQLKQGEKLRIALAIASPKYLPTVEYTSIQEVLEKLAQDQSDRIELLPIVNSATPENIDSLLEQKPDIFHFIGHGRFKDETGEEGGELALVRKVVNSALWVDAEGFADYFNRHCPSIVILQACEGGMQSASQAYVGVAAKIVAQNIPVVVAMQYEVSNAAASSFAEEFYERLGKGEPVDIAVQNARRMVALNTQYKNRDFATPVIFMRVRDGYLFKGEESILTYLSAENIINTSQSYPASLELSSVDKESIEKAYKNSLPPDAILWDLKGNYISQMLKELAEHRCLGEFFNQLSQDESIPLEIRDQFKNAAESLAPKKQPEEKQNRKHPVLEKTSTKVMTKKWFQPLLEKLTRLIGMIPFWQNKPEKLQSYVLATLQHSYNNNKPFLLNAWLIMDDSIADISKFQSLLDQNEPQQGVLCKFDQISQQLTKLIYKAEECLEDKKYQLTIEFFLPSDLMCMEVDRWKIGDPAALERKRTLGTMYPVRLRSLERLEPTYLSRYGNEWKKSWNRIKDILNNQPTPELFEHLQEMEDFNWKLLKIKLSEKIGLKVSRDPHAKIEELFSAILIATTPIAIWTRCDMLNLGDNMDQVIYVKPLCHLGETVRRFREEADAQTEEHLGLHLALLWEDPYRLTPDIMLQLTTPGQ